MLPALTARARRWTTRQAALALLVALLLLGAAATALGALERPEPGAPLPLAERLPAATWGLALPTSWLAAPLVGVRAGDRLDVLALRPGERAASAIAFDIEVMSLDERTVVLGVGASDATALAIARASGQLIVPLLRSTK